MAAFGTLASSKQNYPVRHHAAGLSDYAVPSIDETPVRLLAKELVGTGGFAVTNAGASDEPNKTAGARLQDVENLSAQERSDWVRLVNQEEGYIDLENDKWDAAPSHGG